MEGCGSLVVHGVLPCTKERIPRRAACTPDPRIGGDPLSTVSTDSDETRENPAPTSVTAMRMTIFITTVDNRYDDRMTMCSDVECGFTSSPEMRTTSSMSCVLRAMDARGAMGARMAYSMMSGVVWWVAVVTVEVTSPCSRFRLSGDTYTRTHDNLRDLLICRISGVTRPSGGEPSS